MASWSEPLAALSDHRATVFGYSTSHCNLCVLMLATLVKTMGNKLASPRVVPPILPSN